MSTQILVVEDEQSFQKMLKQYFRHQIKERKYKFIFAENGKEALKEIVNNSQIDLMIVDIKMPQIDGLELLTILSYMNIKIDTIIISAYGDMDKIRKAMNEGAFDFLMKPFDLELLEKAIENNLRRKISKKTGYIEKRFILKKQPTGEQKEYGPYIYFRRRDENKKLSSIYLGKEEPWLQRLIETIETVEVTSEDG
jgi:DNA-binding NtrC family response regulator